MSGEATSNLFCPDGRSKILDGSGNFYCPPKPAAKKTAPVANAQPAPAYIAPQQYVPFSNDIVSTPVNYGGLCTDGTCGNQNPAAAAENRVNAVARGAPRTESEKMLYAQAVADMVPNYDKGTKIYDSFNQDKAMADPQVSAEVARRISAGEPVDVALLNSMGNYQAQNGMYRLALAGLPQAAQAAQRWSNQSLSNAMANNVADIAQGGVYNVGGAGVDQQQAGSNGQLSYTPQGDGGFSVGYAGMQAPIRYTGDNVGAGNTALSLLGAAPNAIGKYRVDEKKAADALVRAAQEKQNEYIREDNKFAQNYGEYLMKRNLEIKQAELDRQYKATGDITAHDNKMELAVQKLAVEAIQNPDVSVYPVYNRKTHTTEYVPKTPAMMNKTPASAPAAQVNPG